VADGAARSVLLGAVRVLGVGSAGGELVAHEGRALVGLAWDEPRPEGLGDLGDACRRFSAIFEAWGVNDGEDEGGAFPRSELR
jgi:hypothetical protein